MIEESQEIKRFVEEAKHKNAAEEGIFSRESEEHQNMTRDEIGSRETGTIKTEIEQKTKVYKNRFLSIWLTNADTLT